MEPGWYGRLMSDLPGLVGQRLRHARQGRGWSLAALASDAGIGKGSLSEIENGVRNPTLSTLYALANALGLPLSAVLAEEVGAEVSSPGITAQLLHVEHDESGTLEVFRMRFEPGSRHESGGHARGVTEHLYVTDGSVRAGRRRRETTIAAGQSATWVSDVWHSYRALDARPASAVLVIRSPRQELTVA
jgi:transcriptional regulator with XRE-family HTH domain